MKNIFKCLFGIPMMLLWINVASAQKNEAKHNNKQYIDSLYAEFNNTVYYAFYNPKYQNSSTTTFTMLKIDIKKDGKIGSINFSDSADSLFVKAFSERPKYHDDYATLEKYAMAKSYKDISLLIPVSFEPDKPDKPITPHTLDLIMRFNKKDFTGKAILLSPIYIKVSFDHGM